MKAGLGSPRSLSSTPLFLTNARTIMCMWDVVPAGDRTSAATTSSAALPVERWRTPDKLFNVVYKAKEAGVHDISIKYKGTHIRGSPFRALQKMSPDASHCTVSAPWLTERKGGKMEQTTDLVQGDDVEVTVSTDKAGDGQLSASVTSMDKNNQKGVRAVVSAADMSAGYKVLLPDIQKPGQYSLELKWSGKPIPASPISIQLQKRLAARDMTVSVS